MGGWVINAEKLRFCHAGDGDCFDRYHQDNLRRRAAEQKKEIKLENVKFFVFSCVVTGKGFLPI